MIRIKVKIHNGQLITGSDRFEEALSDIGNGVVYISLENESNVSSVEDYRRLYFLFRDLLWEADNRGYSKKEFHQMLKRECYMKLMDNSENFDTPPSVLSTKFMSLIGWKRYLDLIKEFAKDEFNIYL